MEIPPMTRGFYVLYREQPGGHYEVNYIGIAGLGKKTAMGGRIKATPIVRKARKTGRISRSSKCTTTSVLKRSGN
jgi:hypothetical protein